MDDIAIDPLYKGVRRQKMKHLLAFRGISRLNDKASGCQVILALSDHLALGLACGDGNRGADCEND
jgi:hypothetical protein